MEKLMTPEELSDIFIKNVNQRYQNQINKINKQLKDKDLDIQIDTEIFLNETWKTLLKNAIYTVINNNIKI